MDTPPPPSPDPEFVMTPQEPPVPGEPQPYTAPPMAKKNTNWKWLAIGGGCLVILCIVLCVIAGVFGFRLIKAGANQSADAQKVLDQFMVAMENRDLEAAQRLFSGELTASQTRSQLENMLDGSNYKLFEGYQTLKVQRFNYQANTRHNVLELGGKIIYDGGFDGTFESTLYEEGGQWKIYAVNVQVEPRKLD